MAWWQKKMSTQSRLRSGTLFLNVANACQDFLKVVELS